MPNSIQKIAVAALVEDMTLYPRHAVDTAHVAALSHALESGVELPAIVADHHSKRIVDGFHRCRAFIRVFGPDAEINVEFIEYINDAEMIRDAVARNASHGRRLDGIDRTRSVIMLRTIGMTDEEIGQTLHVPAKRVEKLAMRIAIAPKSSDTAIPTTQMIALKRCVAHLDGSRITKKQADAHRSLPGTSFLLLVQQLTMAIENDLLDYENEFLIVALEHLGELLQSVAARQRIAS